MSQTRGHGKGGWKRQGWKKENGDQPIQDNQCLEFSSLQFSSVFIYLLTQQPNGLLQSQHKYANNMHKQA